MASVLVIAATAPLDAGDSVIQTVLEEMGHTVTVASQNQAYTAVDLNAYGLVVIAESVTAVTFEANAGTAARDTTAPVALFEHGAWDYCNMATGRLRSSATGGVMWVVDDTHPAAGHLNNAAHEFTTDTTSGSDYAVGLGAGAVVVYSWHEAKTNPNGFAYDSGAQMAVGTAPARRFGMGFYTDIIAGLRTPGEQMLRGIFHWLITGTALPAVEPDPSVEILILAQEWEADASTADVGMKNRLTSQGWSVQIVDDDFWRDSWSVGRSLVIEVSSCRGEPLWYSLTNIDCPLITSEGEWTNRTMGVVGSPPTNGHFDATTLYLEETAHPIAAGLATGTITIHSSSAGLNWCYIPRQAPYEIIAANNNGSPDVHIAAVEAGSTLEDGSTNAHRIVYHWHYHTSFDFYTADALTLFDAAVEWAAGENQKLATPTNFSFTSASSALQIDGSWSPVAEANSYGWEVEEDVGGVWVALASGATAATSFQLGAGDGINWSTTYRSRVRSEPTGV